MANGIHLPLKHKEGTVVGGDGGGDSGGWRWGRGQWWVEMGEGTVVGGDGGGDSGGWR